MGNVDKKQLIAKIGLQLLAFGIAMLFGAWLTVQPAAAAETVLIGPGDLIKLPDDGNLDTQHDSAVYYYGNDGKRYVFPNAQTYFTWYSDFSGVKEIPAEQLAGIGIGGNITYRPGTRLVKITSDPKVYAVEPGGVLRPIDSEGVAIGLYGDQWNKIIDDVPDAYFFNYTIGDPLTAAIYPEGSVVKRTSDGAYFLVEGRSKRMLGSQDIRDALRLQESHVLTAAGDLSDYPDGEPITAAEPKLTDTAQKTVTNISSIPGFRQVAPASAFAAVGDDTDLLVLKVSSAKPATITSMKVKLEGIGPEAEVPAEDYDEGGLVYKNNAQTNIKLIRFVDEGGQEPFGRKELVADVTQDASQTLIFSGFFSLPAGQERTLYLKGKINDLLPTGHLFQATLAIDGVRMIDVASGQAAAFTPNKDIVGSELSTLNAQMQVKPGDVLIGETVVRGRQDAAINSISFEATKEAPNVIKSIRFQGFIDEEGTAGFLAGQDADNGTATEVRQVVPRVYLYDDQTKLAGPVEVDLNGQALFSGLNFNIPAGGTAALTVRGDTNALANLEEVADRIMFDISDPLSDMAVTDERGGTVQAVGREPNGGHQALSWMTVRPSGALDFNWVGGSGPVLAGETLEIGTLTTTAGYDDYRLTTLGFVLEGGPVRSMPGPLVLTYPKQDGSQGTASASIIGNAITFNSIDAHLSGTSALTVSGTVLPRDGGAIYGDIIQLKADPAANLRFVSLSNSQAFTYEDLGQEIGPNADLKFLSSRNRSSYWDVRYSTLEAAVLAADSPEIYKESNAEILKFSLKAGDQGGVRVQKLTFHLSGWDGGADANNTDNVMDLVWEGIGSYEEKIGEGYDGDIRRVGDYLTVDLANGREWSIPAGATHNLALRLDMTQMTNEVDITVGATLTAGPDFLWTDLPSGIYTALDGNLAHGLPLSDSRTLKY